MPLHQSNLVVSGFLSAVITAMACGGSISSIGDEPILNGQISSWDQGGTYQLTATLQARGNSGNYRPPTVPIDAEGRFTITLPGESVLANIGTPQPIKAGSTCSGTLAAEPGEALFVSLTLSDNAPNPMSVHQLHEEISSTVAYQNGVAVGYKWLDRDLTLSGTVSCPFNGSGGGSLVTVYDGAQYRKGWNRELYTFSYRKETVATGPAPEGLLWVRSYTAPSF